MDTGDAGLFYLLFCTVYCIENRLINNMTPYEPRHEKTCLGTDHLIFWGGGWGGGAGFFPRGFLPIEKQRFFFSQSESQNIFFQDKAKTKFYFFLNSIYARNVFFKIYTFVYFLNPIYMGILFIRSCIHVSWIFGSECI